MKGIKKLLTGIIAATMVIGSSMTAFATESTPSIAETATVTINPKTDTDGSIQDVTYTYYQILRASLPSGADTSATNEDRADIPVSYYLNTSTDSDMKALLAPESNGTFTATLTADGSKWIMESSISDGETMRNALNTADIKSKALATGSIPVNSETKVATTTLPVGYYLIESSLGTVVALQTVGNVTITEKNDYITTTKTAAKTSYNVGDNVEYTATVSIPDDAKIDVPNDNTKRSIVVLHDIMDSVLAFNANSVTAILPTDADPNATFSSDNYTVKVASDRVTLRDTDCTFEIEIPVTRDLLGKTITFKYTAELKSDEVDADGFVNELFGELNGYKTNPDSPVVYTYDFNLDKTFAGAVGTENYNATFEVRKNESGNPISFVQVTTTDGKINYRKAHTGDNGSTTVTVEQGKTSNFYGLDAGTYYLVETGTNAPGYNILTKAIAVTITPSTDNKTCTVTYKKVGDTTEEEGTVTIENTKGSLLPSTGGIGTTIFYIIGGVLIIAGVAYFIVRRKSIAE